MVFLKRELIMRNLFLIGAKNLHSEIAYQKELQVLSNQELVNYELFPTFLILIYEMVR